MRSSGWYWVRMNDKFKWSVAFYRSGEWTQDGKVLQPSLILEIGDEFKKIDPKIRPMKASMASCV